VALAESARFSAGASVGCAVIASQHGDDTQVDIGVVTPHGTRRETGVAFLRGSQGSHRAALSAATILRQAILDVQPGIG
jgi:hypothetical protein